MTGVEFRLLGSMELAVEDVPAKLPGVAERGLAKQASSGSG